MIACLMVMLNIHSFFIEKLNQKSRMMNIKFSFQVCAFLQSEFAGGSLNLNNQCWTSPEWAFVVDGSTGLLLWFPA